MHNPPAACGLNREMWAWQEKAGLKIDYLSSEILNNKSAHCGVISHHSDIAIKNCTEVQSHSDGIDIVLSTSPSNIDWNASVVLLV